MNSISSSLYEFQDPAFPPALPGEPETCEFDTLFRSFDFDIVNGARLEPLSIDPAQYFFSPAYEDNIPVEQAMGFPQVTHEDVALQGIGEEEPSPLHRSSAERDEKYKAYQKKYKETHKAHQKEYYETHKAEIAAKRKKHRETHKAEIAARKKKHYETHKAKIKEHRETHKDYQKEYYETHKAKIAAQQKERYAMHKKEINEKRQITRDIDKLFLSRPDIFDNFPVNLPLDKLPNLA